jgi:hypothetical protein
MDDFPAAHSMDTEWFAVDSSGCLARFDSGEDGAVPLQAATGLSSTDPSFDVAILEALQLVRVVAARGVPEGWSRQGSPPTSSQRIVAITDGAQLPESSWIRLSTGAPAGAISRAPLSAAQVREIAATPGVLCTFEESDLHELLLEPQGEEGVFCYDREHGEDPGRYARKVIPRDPIRIEELPAPVQEALRGFSLPFSCSVQASVHLADLLTPDQAATWGDLPLRYPPGGPQPMPPQVLTPGPGKARVVLVLALAVAFLLLVLWLRGR